MDFAELQNRRSLLKSGDRAALAAQSTDKAANNALKALRWLSTDE